MVLGLSMAVVMVLGVRVARWWVVRIMWMILLDVSVGVVVERMAMRMILGVGVGMLLVGSI